MSWLTRQLSIHGNYGSMCLLAKKLISAACPRLCHSPTGMECFQWDTISYWIIIIIIDSIQKLSKTTHILNTSFQVRDCVVVLFLSFCKLNIYLPFLNQVLQSFWTNIYNFLNQIVQFFEHIFTNLHLNCLQSHIIIIIFINNLTSTLNNFKRQRQRKRMKSANTIFMIYI